SHALSMILSTVNAPMPWTWPPSVDDLKTAKVTIQSAVKDLQRKRATPQSRIGFPAQAAFVSITRLGELQAIPNATWDVTRLVRLCEELNLVHEAGCIMATAMLGRAVMDHIPPIFGKGSFAEVANNHTAGGQAGKSFKESMENLQKSVRPIADSHLHLHIRHKEVLPSPVQVQFGRDLDVLLGEVIRLLKP
ncbi:MAG: hypothetical protein ACAH21_11585, partial [Ramlibacter sp.]